MEKYLEDESTWNMKVHTKYVYFPKSLLYSLRQPELIYDLHLV